MSFDNILTGKMQQRRGTGPVWAVRFLAAFSAILLVPISLVGQARAQGSLTEALSAGPVVSPTRMI
ncbi:MAG: hypothetical protein O7A03_09805, partial [Alphaproteobacteria bacterium]|nr:hypothetical protein [Alphaproteobacteria bacterium]